MYCLLAALLLLGSVALSDCQLSVNTSTVGMDEASGSVSVPGPAFISQVNIGSNPKLKPPKNVKPNKDIIISSNSQVQNGTAVNEVDSSVNSIGDKAAGKKKGSKPGKINGKDKRNNQGDQINDLISNLMPQVPSVVLPIGFPDLRSEKSSKSDDSSSSNSRKLDENSSSE